MVFKLIGLWFYELKVIGANLMLLVNMTLWDEELKAVASVMLNFQSAKNFYQILDLNRAKN